MGRRAEKKKATRASFERLARVFSQLLPAFISRVSPRLPVRRLDLSFRSTARLADRSYQPTLYDAMNAGDLLANTLSAGPPLVSPPALLVPATLIFASNRPKYA
jgi:hypothetical protein